MLFEPQTLLDKKLVPLFKTELATLDKREGVCQIFGTNGDVYCWSDSYSVPYAYSAAAAIFTLGSLEILGLNKGTWEKPTNSMRFMDYKSAFLIVPVSDDPIEFWCSGNYFQKLSPTTSLKTKELAGNAAYVSLLEDQRALMVIEISIRKEIYLKNLMIGDEDNLVLATETGTIITPRKGWQEFKQAFLKLPKSNRTEALVLLRGVTTGKVLPTSDRVQKFYSENMEFAVSAKETLPTNPHARTIWLAAIGAVV